jgi:hypothetical protein
MEARDARETRNDWYTARVVAMLVAVNSKHGKYEPRKYMMNGKRLQERAERDRREREPMTGEQVLARFRQLGVRVIDKRKGAVSDQQSAVS